MNVQYQRFLLGALLFASSAAPPSLAQVSLVADLAPGGLSSGVANLIVYDDALFFTAEADSDARGLWRYDAPSGPAELVLPLDLDEGGIGLLTVADDRLYFTIEDLLETGAFPHIWA